MKTEIEIPSSMQALIFDCDGTLVDTMPLHWEAWQEALEASGVVVREKRAAIIEFLKSRAGQTTEALVPILNSTFDLELDTLSFTELKEACFEPKLAEVQPLQPIAELAKEHYGKLQLAVVSGGVFKNVHASLAACGLEQLFPVIITADDPVEPKPSPEVFLEAARRLAVEPRYCHVFEDADPGIQGAVAAGMSYTDVRSLL